MGRLTWLLQGQWGDRASWTGASLGAVFRGRVRSSASSFRARESALEQHELRRARGARRTLSGASAWTAWDRTSSRTTLSCADALVRHLDPLLMPPTHRAIADAAVTRRAAADPRRLAVREPGRFTRGRRHRRRGGSRALTRAQPPLPVHGLGHEITVDGDHGRIPQTLERFAIGGLAPPLVDSALLEQRIAMPVLPIAVAHRRAAAAFARRSASPIWRPYYWIGNANDRFGSPTQVIGIEGPGKPRGSGWCACRRPPARRPWLALTGPVRHHAQAYLSITYRP